MIKSLINKCTKVFNKFGLRKTIVETSFLIEVRRAVYCRLLFFNGRRSKEISCLSTKQWHLAKKNYYSTPQQKKFLENDGVSLNILEDNFHVVVTIGKSKDVPVIIPKVLFAALDFLSDSKILTLCHVNQDKTFLFPSGMNSLRHSSGQENLRTFLKGGNRR